MALAFALLLTSACDKNEIVNTENTADKGYALPVTINVSRQGDDGTKATFNDGTKKLAFSTGDKLFVCGSDVTAGVFAGALTWTSGGTFSGTILTQNEYSGTADELLTAASDTYAYLLPNGYESYGFLTITNEDTYSADVSSDYNYAFATSKAAAVEQFSYESSDSYSNGFALTPESAILNFTITGLAASTEVAVAFSGECSASGTVTTDGSGTATFAVGVMGDLTDLNGISLTVGDNAITLVSSSTPLTAGKIYNIARSALILNPAVGQVIGDDGKNYAAGSLPSGVTAVAIITYVGSDNGEAAPYNHGLALAMTDAGGGSYLQWSTSTSDADHSKQTDSDNFTIESGLQYNATHNTDDYPAFKAAIANNSTAAPTGCSAWFLASGYQWTKMFAGDAEGLKTLAGLAWNYYWSSSERDAYNAWRFYSDDGYWNDDGDDKGFDSLVRSCLAF